MARIMGLDLGSRTCGIAMSDPLGIIASGVETYRFPDDAYKRCAKYVRFLARENDVHTIVLGLPKHMNGDLGERAQITIAFKEMLESMMGDVEIILEDERLSTVVAENNLLMADLSRKKRKEVIDKMAAVTILQGYLDRVK